MMGMNTGLLGSGLPAFTGTQELFLESDAQPRLNPIGAFCRSRIVNSSGRFT